MLKAAYTVALAGNPNVGKSTLFNRLTGLRQHTGNWPGKTVGVARGRLKRDGLELRFIDLPGTYSLNARSPEEELAKDFLARGEADAVIVVLDASCLERTLPLALQAMALTGKVLICLNLMDEAKRRGIRIDWVALEEALGVPVCPVSARTGRGVEELLGRLEALLEKGSERPRAEPLGAEALFRRAEELRAACAGGEEAKALGRGLDGLLAGRALGVPLLLALLSLIFYLTIAGANLPSRLLGDWLFALEERISLWMRASGVNEFLIGASMRGVWRVTAWVVSVMLPPMAIFFPLFTLLEDWGLLPRVAFLLDEAFRRAKSCGKQALTMMMGFGCNAAGVTGCRIIDSPRERLIAILTNALVPCNGRFPLLILLLGLCLPAGAFIQALGLTGLIVLSVLVTLCASRLLSQTVLRGEISAFALELPPFRRPDIGRVVVRSALDRTLFVLGRAVAVAAPAGLVIYLLSAPLPGGASALKAVTKFLDAPGRLLGLDGTLLTAFILSFPANELALPVALMLYAGASELTQPGGAGEIALLLKQNGFGLGSCVSMMLFTLFHWPCSTTLISVKKETGSLKWTLVAFLLPTAIGALLCAGVTLLLRALPFF